jgi:hypothetical protein
MPFDPQFAKYVAAATVLMTLQPIITSASKVEGRYEYLQVSVTLLAELSKKRSAPTSGIPLEPVLARLIRPHVALPRIALAESLLAFQKEAKDAGFVVHLPRVVAELNEERRQELLRTFYGRLARGGAV